MASTPLKAARIFTLLTCICVAGYLHLASAKADELVKFESAPVKPSAFRERLARARGEVLTADAGPLLQAYMTRPTGNGPFPAVVILHACGGIGPSKKVAWPERLASWGYVVLVVDSFTTRGIGNTCGRVFYDRVYDAYGALEFLSGQSFVDPERIALMGFSAGGDGTLQAVQLGAAEVLFDRKFKAAVAYYPFCSVTGGEMTAPTLILIGELDDWTPAAECRKMMAQRGGRGSPVRLVAYDGAHHGFDAPEFGTGMKIDGHWLEYDPTAADRSAKEVRAFLQETIGK